VAEHDDGPEKQTIVQIRTHGRFVRNVRWTSTVVADNVNDPMKLTLLLPTHAVPSDGTTRVRRLPGRPKQATLAPDVDEQVYADSLNALRAEWESNDALVRALQERQPVAEVFQALKLAIAEETAALGFDKKQAAAQGRDVAQLAGRRIDALLKLAHVELLRVRLGVEVLDYQSPRVQRAVRLLLDEVGRVADETLGSESAERFMTLLRAKTADWQTEFRDSVRPDEH
jgi:hypothetical protein